MNDSFLVRVPCGTVCNIRSVMDVRNIIYSRKVLPRIICVGSLVILKIQKIRHLDCFKRNYFSVHWIFNHHSSGSPSGSPWWQKLKHKKYHRYEQTAFRNRKIIFKICFKNYSKYTISIWYVCDNGISVTK